MGWIYRVGGANPKTVEGEMVDGEFRTFESFVFAFTHASVHQGFLRNHASGRRHHYTVLDNDTGEYVDLTVERVNS
tara:strand:+ start:567 stop:794 length:228 start_codon:yes stop_codon:yes gene_type:complete